MFFNRKSKYYYGDGTNHILKLKPRYVKSFLRFQKDFNANDYTLEQLASGVFVNNVTRKDLGRYNAIADILNAYCESHTVYYNDTTQPVLRRVK